MKITPKETTIVMGLLIGAALLWEGLALGFGTQSTISEFVWNMSGNTAFVFACGFLAGHFFFPKSKCVHCGKFPYRKDK